MENISNAKIEKLKKAIDVSKEKIAEYQERLKEQEKLLIVLENLEIVARFRNRSGNEDLAARLRNERQNPSTPVSAGHAEQEKEVVFNDTV
jgi:predicted RNA-binding protein with PUA domain